MINLTKRVSKSDFIRRQTEPGNTFLDKATLLKKINPVLEFLNGKHLTEQNWFDSDHLLIMTRPPSVYVNWQREYFDPNFGETELEKFIGLIKPLSFLGDLVTSISTEKSRRENTLSIYLLHRVLSFIKWAVETYEEVEFVERIPRNEYYSTTLQLEDGKQLVFNRETLKMQTQVGKRTKLNIPKVTGKGQHATIRDSTLIYPPKHGKTDEPVQTKKTHSKNSVSNLEFDDVKEEVREWIDQYPSTYKLGGFDETHLASWQFKFKHIYDEYHSLRIGQGEHLVALKSPKLYLYINPNKGGKFRSAIIEEPLEKHAFLDVGSKDYCAETAIEKENIKTLVRDLLGGLARFTHNDIKTINFLKTIDGHYKWIDMGLSQDRHPEILGGSYIPPDRLINAAHKKRKVTNKATQQSDVWTFSWMLMDMLFPDIIKKSLKNKSSYAYKMLIKQGEGLELADYNALITIAKNHLTQETAHGKTVDDSPKLWALQYVIIPGLAVEPTQRPSAQDLLDNLPAQIE